jgi:quercetin dioxygenase-like cupin family protein
MKIVMMALVLFAALGLVSYSVAHDDHAHKDHKQDVKLENLFHQALNKDFVDGREVVVSHVTIQPNTTLPKHYHPGEEFIYCLEGEFELHIDGQDVIVGKAGDVLHVPYMAKHTAITKDLGGSAIVFRLHTAGEPERILVDAPKADK